MLSKLVLTSLLTACTGSVTPKPVSPVEEKPLRVEIVNHRPNCFLPEQPTPPDVPEWPTGQEDYYRRIYVHRRDYDLLYQHVMDLRHRQELIMNCVKELSEWSH